MSDVNESINFECDGVNYAFQAHICGYMPDNQLTSYAIQNSYLISYMQVNKLNSLCLTGELEFEDHDGSVSWLHNASHTYAIISFSKHEVERDGEIEVDTYPERQAINHTFLIDNIEVVDRVENVITYKLYLKSQHWYNLSRSVFFSNYDVDQEDIFKIIQKILVACVGEQQISKSFGDVQGEAKINYAASPSDNFFTAFAYLYRRLFYGETKSTSVKGLYFDEYANTFSTFDNSSIASNSMVHNDHITMTQQNAEQMMANSGQVNIGSIVTFSKTDEYEFDFAKRFVDYDYSTNKFINRNISSTELTQFQNMSIAKESEHVNGQAVFTDLSKSHVQYMATWNNNINVPAMAFKRMIGENAMIINVKGKLGRQVNDYEQVSTDVSEDNARSENIDDIQDIKTKGLGVSGLWLIVKVVNIIDFKEKLYRQNLIMTKTAIPETPK